MNQSKRVTQSLLLVALAGALYGGKLVDDRQYEPVVLQGDKIPAVTGLPVDQMFVYAYKNQTWEMIPFQVDERVKLNDPDLSKENDDRKRHFYVIANTNPEYVRPDTTPAFDIDDELVFMIRDAGDMAPADAWIDNEESKSNNRYELILTDPLSNDTAYVYIFHSSTLTMPEEVADRYQMQFDPVTHTIQTMYYLMRVNQENGLVADIAIKPPFGNGLDIFDTQKFRMNGHMNWGQGIDLYFGPENDANSATEAILKIYSNDVYLAYTDHPVVRVIREVRQGIRLTTGTDFYIKTLSYPFSGYFEGGTILDPDKIRETLDDPSVEVAIEIDYLRQSWDFNENASGMKFYNTHNSQIPVDGNSDSPNLTIDVPDDSSRLQIWAMVTGNQGTLFNFFDFAESNWDGVSLYYYDNKNGGQADNDIIIANDSGDNVSYGDNGLRFTNTSFDKPLNLDFSFLSYMLPANQNTASAENLKKNIISPVNISITGVPYTTGVSQKPLYTQPDAFVLYQNYPNPFNLSTRIIFSLNNAAKIHLIVYNSQGQPVWKSENQTYSAGKHTLEWDAINQDGMPLPSGLYIIRLETPQGISQRKMILLK